MDVCRYGSAITLCEKSHGQMRWDWLRNSGSTPVGSAVNAYVKPAQPAIGGDETSMALAGKSPAYPSVTPKM